MTDDKLEKANNLQERIRVLKNTIENIREISKSNKQYNLYLKPFESKIALPALEKALENMLREYKEL